MKRLKYCVPFLLACSPVVFSADLYEYKVEQSYVVIEGNSSQGSYFPSNPGPVEPVSYQKALDNHQIPRLTITGEPGWIHLNETAWKTFYDHIREPATYSFNGKEVPVRPSSQFSDNEYFWDQCLIKAGFARYAHRDINTRGGLDSFFSVQHMNGFIPREILSDGRENRLFPGQNLLLRLDSKPVPPPEMLNVMRGVNAVYNIVTRALHSIYYRGQKSQIQQQVLPLIQIYTEENKNNPPLAAHAEWQAFLLSRDTERLKRVINVLREHTRWLEGQRQIKEGELKGLFWQRVMASGMDNLPSQFQHWKTFQTEAAALETPDYYDLSIRKNDASFDISAQMKLHYDAMANIEAQLNYPENAKAWRTKSDSLKSLINQCMWDDEYRFYFNVNKSCNSKDRTYTLSGYWALYAKIATPSQAKAMLSFLKSASYFNTYMPFPTLAASHPQFSPTGNYWKGGVWPPLNYITIQGLMNYTQVVPEAWSVAVKATKRYLNQLSNTMEGSCLTNNDLEGSCLLESPGESEHSFASRIYEYNSPSTGGRGSSPAAQGYFVGWGGLGPIALMQEVAIGINVMPDEIVWYVNRHDTHGIKHLNIGPASLDLTLKGRFPEFTLEDLEVSVFGDIASTGIRHIRVINKSTNRHFIYPLTRQKPLSASD